MKKTLFILLAIWIATLSIQAATIQVSPGANTIYNAINAAASGDVLVIADGIYNEPNTTVINKALTIQAADGASPFINHKRYDINLSSGQNVTIKGLILDNTLQTGTEPVRVISGTNNSLSFIDCTFQNGTSYGIRLYNTAVQVESLIISGCLFQNFGNYAIYTVEGGTSPGLFKNCKIENSTFINITGSAILLRNHDAAEGNDPGVMIDHCTFYNTATGVNNYAIYLYKIAGATIQNCIVSNDADKKSDYAYYVYGGTNVKNSIWYNCTNGVRSSGAVTTNLINADPKFISPALKDFNFDASSPAAGAATDGKNIGDLRWNISAQELGINVTTPAKNEETSDIYHIRFVPSDPVGNATISLFYSLDNVSWTPIVEGLASSVLFYDWNVRNFSGGSYYVKAVIDDGTTTIAHTAAGKVVVVPDVIPPRNPSDLSGVSTDGKIILTWKNPTSLVPVITQINDFESGVGNFVEAKDGAEGSFAIATGHVGTGLQVNFDIQTAWKEYGVKTNLASPVNYVSTVELWYKGDGSSNKIRIIIQQANGDWWYNESLSLNSTEWKKATLNANLFTAFSWKPNKESSFDYMNVTALNFIVASGVATTGHFVIDDIVFSGNILPSIDFAGTKLVRRTDQYPANYTDGTLVYNGTLETFVDEDILANANYYYAAFAYDDLGNHSAFDNDAAYMYSGLSTSTNTIKHLEATFKIYPNLITTSANMLFNLNNNQKVIVEIYSSIGMKVAEIINQEMPQGSHTISLNVNTLSNGLYFVKMIAGKEIKTERILINK